MSTFATSKEEENTIPCRRLSISRRTSFKSVEIHKNVSKHPSYNEEIKETDEKELETLQQQNNVLQNTINTAKLTLWGEKTADSSNILFFNHSLDDILQKQLQKMQQLSKQNDELKTELVQKEDSYSEKVLFLTQKNEDTIKICDQKIKQLISQKDKITAELRQEHHNQIQQMSQKLQQMETEITQLNTQTQTVDKADSVCKMTIDGSNGSDEMLTMKERSYENLKTISYSKLFIYEKKKVRVSNNYYNMKYILRQYYMTRVIVFGIGVCVLPPKLVACVSLGTANAFNWMYAFKYGTKEDLIKHSVLFSIELFSAKYLSDIKHIGAGIAVHGLSDLFNAYQLHINQRNSSSSSIIKEVHQVGAGIIKEVGISAMLNIVIGVGTMLLSPKQQQRTLSL